MATVEAVESITEQAPRGYRKVGQHRYRELVGFCYEELSVGTTVEHRPGRTVTDMDNV